MNQEIWKPWPQNPKYQISSQGRVKGLNGRIMKPKKHKGYLWINLAVEPKKPKTYSIHRLVAETFLSDFHQDLTVDHINNNREDNRVDNLRMMSRSENISRGNPKSKQVRIALKYIISKIGYEETEKILNNIIKGLE